MLYIYVCVCVGGCVCIYIYIILYTLVSICLSVCLSIYLATYLALYLSIESIYIYNQIYICISYILCACVFRWDCSWSLRQYLNVLDMLQRPHLIPPASKHHMLQRWCQGWLSEDRRPEPGLPDYKRSRKVRTQFKASEEVVPLHASSLFLSS